MNKKQISLWQATAIGLGNIIGARIFVLAGTVINQAGPGAVLSFLLTAILAITVALNSAELSSKIVSHGGLLQKKLWVKLWVLWLAGLELFHMQ